MPIRFFSAKRKHFVNETVKETVRDIDLRDDFSEDESSCEDADDEPVEQLEPIVISQRKKKKKPKQRRLRIPKLTDPSSPAPAILPQLPPPPPAGPPPLPPPSIRSVLNLHDTKPFYFLF